MGKVKEMKKTVYEIRPSEYSFDVITLEYQNNDQGEDGVGTGKIRRNGLLLASFLFNYEVTSNVQVLRPKELVEALEELIGKLGKERG